MQYSSLIKSEKISKLGFGLMRLPKIDENSEDIDFEKAGELVDIAIKSGVNYFDTAFVYNGGNSEEFVGEVLTKYPRKSFYLATKLPGWSLKTNPNPKELFDFQLERCNVEYFDFYLLHSVNDDIAEVFEKTGSYEFLRQMKKEGKIKNIGFSFHGSLSLFKRWLKEYEWDFVQIQLNYYDWENQDAKTLYRLLEEKGIPCIVMEPVRGGSLQKLNDEARAVFSELSDDSPASYALRFAAQLPNVLTVLSGMSDKEQVLDNIKTFSGNIPLSEEETTAVNKAAVLFRKNFAVPCTSCGYCLEACPNSIAIPDIFMLFNEYNLSRDDAAFNKSYKDIPENKNAGLCVECGECIEHCPQKIDIPKKLKHIHKVPDSIG